MTNQHAQRSANPYAGRTFKRNSPDNLRREAYRITDSYAIARDKAIEIIAKHGNVEDVKEAEVQQWLDKIAADCIDKVTKGKPVPKNNPTPKKTHVESVGEICNDVCQDAGLLSSDAVVARTEALKALGHHKMPHEYRAWVTEWASRQPKPIRAAQPALITAPAEEKKPMPSSPFGDKPLSPEAKAKLDAESAIVMQRLAEQERAKLASADETPSPDLETTFNNLEQAANKVSEVVSQDAQVTVEKSPPAIETASASAVEPPIENEAPTSATEASNVIEGEIVEDKKPEPTAEEINRLRVDVDRLIISTWPDLNGKDKVEGRVAHIKAIYPDCEGMQAVYVKYGYDVAYKMAHVYCTEKILQPSASALVSVADQPMNITPISSAPSARNFKMPTPEEFQMMQTFANAVAKSGLYAEVNTFDKAFVILWKGFELGVGLGAALDGIYIINGRPWPGAQILKAVVMASGLAVRFDVTCDETQAMVTIQRKGMEVHQYKFTKAEAIQAKLWDSKTWEKHPKRMMMHRATRLAIITDFPDLAAGIGIAIDGEDEDMIDNADVAEQKAIA